jgi:hypothetical protein
MRPLVLHSLLVAAVHLATQITPRISPTHAHKRLNCDILAPFSISISLLRAKEMAGSATGQRSTALNCPNATFSPFHPSLHRLCRNSSSQLPWARDWKSDPICRFVQRHYREWWESFALANNFSTENPNQRNLYYSSGAVSALPSLSSSCTIDLRKSSQSPVRGCPRHREIGTANRISLCSGEN